MLINLIFLLFHAYLPLTFYRWCNVDKLFFLFGRLSGRFICVEVSDGNCILLKLCWSTKTTEHPIDSKPQKYYKFQVVCRYNKYYYKKNNQKRKKFNECCCTLWYCCCWLPRCSLTHSLSKIPLNISLDVLHLIVYNCRWSKFIKIYKIF